MAPSRPRRLVPSACSTALDGAARSRCCTSWAAWTVSCCLNRAASDGARKVAARTRSHTASRDWVAGGQCAVDVSPSTTGIAD
ncbi:hypothetical protein [Jiangella endophytica]|uniref:hypothetical protein n=1 Tax=Jiangella endophytica TaxID=1623398 RepID=UPI0013003BA1|nr:hypothetical protein [Jiangella endophytica]